jgi:hypothetical protein
VTTAIQGRAHTGRISLARNGKGNSPPVSPNLWLALPHPVLLDFAPRHMPARKRGVVTCCWLARVRSASDNGRRTFMGRRSLQHAPSAKGGSPDDSLKLSAPTPEEFQVFDPITPFCSSYSDPCRGVQPF